MKIAANEVVSVLLKAIVGLVEVSLLSEKSWRETWAGNVEYEIGLWRVTFFCDAGELDYVDSAIAPDGRTVEYEEWFDPKDGSGADPIELLSDEGRRSLLSILEASISPKKGL
ncbi:Uncharacterised protein [Burkholderia cepacia]|uniref:DUF7693 domain-containing protein n=1 Tax=Burkholderia cepacia TaxID=292 RepID=A0AAE8N8Q7_BURCE|nr:hypothetical protein [Burkholderia cepacia]POM15763.1 hypothetical protein CSX04_04052 [Burkholderia cepacia]SPV11611.1 Uncharacterised protein [Burkholderia cepacia]